MDHAQELIQQVEQARRKFTGAVSALSDRQSTFKPAPDEWSVVEVVEHLYLAEISGVAKIWAALRFVQSGVHWTDPLPNRGKPIEMIIAETWKTKETAPPIATPHIGGPLSFWLSATRSLTMMLDELGTALQSVRLEEVVFPHFLCGPLDSRQRLEFLRFHIERHADQVERIKRSADFPTQRQGASS